MVRNCGRPGVGASITVMPTFYAADGTELAYRLQGEGTRWSAYLAGRCVTLPTWVISVACPRTGG